MNNRHLPNSHYVSSKEAQALEIQRQQHAIHLSSLSAMTSLMDTLVKDPNPNQELKAKLEGVLLFLLDPFCPPTKNEQPDLENDIIR